MRGGECPYSDRISQIGLKGSGGEGGSRATMQELEPTSEEATILNRYLKAGGILDFVFIGCTDGEDVASEETHRQALLLGMKCLQERLGYFSEFAVATELERLEPVRAPFEIDGHRLNALRGKRISKTEFLGPRYDIGRQSLKADSMLGSDDAGGFAYAFADTPQGLWLRGDERQDLFDEVISTVLGGIDDDSTIFEWPTDWSSYFEAGREWWGCFLWTLCNPGANRITMIAASTTD